MKQKIKYKILKFEIFSLITIMISGIHINLKTHNEFKNQVLEFEMNNEDLVKLYNEYITLLANFYKEKYDNPFDICNEFSMMYYNGLLSYGDNEFNISEPKYDINKYGGLDVVNGKGLCRNINCCFTDVLKKIGYECGNVYGALNEENEFNLSINHIVTWINIDGNIYLLDPFNAIILKKDNLVYKSENGTTFIPSYIVTKKFDEEMNYKMFFSDNKEIETKSLNEISNLENIINCFSFEKDKLEEIEKQIVLKLDALQ